MDNGLVPKPRQDRKSLLHLGQSERRGARGQRRSRERRAQNPAQSDEGRVVSLRAELLSALPPRRAHGATGRHVDLPPRISLRRSRRKERLSAGPQRGLRSGASPANFVATTACSIYHLAPTLRPGSLAGGARE